MDTPSYKELSHRIEGRARTRRNLKVVALEMIRGYCSAGNVWIQTADSILELVDKI
jgi:hypothetical protein